MAYEIGKASIEARSKQKVVEGGFAARLILLVAYSAATYSSSTARMNSRFVIWNIARAVTYSTFGSTLLELWKMTVLDRKLVMIKDIRAG